MGMSQLVNRLENAGNEQIRSEIFDLSGGNIEDKPLFPHQMQALHNIYENENRSGILKFPTGGGKTRTALAYMAKELKRDRSRRFIWSTYPTKVLRQGMCALAELAGEFDADISFAWYDSEWKTNRGLLEDVDILFVMRDQFSQMMEHSCDGRVRNNPLLRVYDKNASEEQLNLSLIYDECHQLGAQKLQKRWEEFDRTHGSIHCMGLSATPVPSDVEKSYFLSNTIFSLPEDGSIRGERPDWNMLCHSDVDFRDLQDQDVLCEMNKPFEHERDFDISVDCSGTSSLPKNPTKGQVEEFVSQFNNHKIAEPDVIRSLAQDIAHNIDELGKTLVFVPTIQAANRLTGQLELTEELEGKVTMVHSRLGEFVEEEGKEVDAADRNKQVREFMNRGTDNCVMVNVGMLTTGFDDPKIKSVILARLTTSNNLFWQMVGRGLRGPAVNGTGYCNIIDPIRLSDKFQAVDGYRAGIEDKMEEWREVLEKNPDDFEGGSDGDIISTIQTREYRTRDEKPLSADCKEAVKAALAGFVGYENFKEAVQDDSEVRTTLGWCYELIENVEADLNADLSWMKQKSFLPGQDSDTDLEHFHRKVEVCREKGITTEDGWKSYVTSVI